MTPKAEAPAIFPFDTALHTGMPVRFTWLRDAASIYGEQGMAPSTASSAGIDLRACIEEEEAVLAAGQRMPIGSGIAIEPLVHWVAGFVYSRSGLGAVQGLTVSQGVGVIDPDYRGEIVVSILNTSGEERRIKRGDRIAQLIFQPFVRAHLQAVDELGETARGAGGFGHTGTR